MNGLTPSVLFSMVAAVALGACADYETRSIPTADANNHSGHAAQTAARMTDDHSMHISRTPDAHSAHMAAVSNSRYEVSSVSYELPDVALLDHLGLQHSLATVLSDDVPIALNFIFTTCTTICPVMTATFAQARSLLGDSADRINMVSISIDPEYDRPEVLRAYAARFSASEENWTFLTGDSADIINVLTSFDVYAGSKMNHQPVTMLRRAGETSWIRIDGLASGADLAREFSTQLLN